MRVVLAYAVSLLMAVLGVTFTSTSSSTPKHETSGAAIQIDYTAKLKVMDPVPDIFDELIGKKIPSFTYMLYVATCETTQEWNHGGTYGGGFGFMQKSNKVYSDYVAEQSTWLQWGGWQFAKKAQHATSKEQALVWIRTYATGWVRPNGVYKPPTNLPRSHCHDDMKVGWHEYKGEEWPVPDTWKKGDPQIKPWDK